jgi:eukaryotic-like serine/threonine-protein kinase
VKQQPAFFISKKFIIHLSIIIFVVFTLFFAILKWLSVYTNHGEFVVVPEFVGQNISELDAYTAEKNVSWQIIDSIYDPREKPGTVLRQDPEPESKVKHNRKVYLYVTGMVPPQVLMPKLTDRSERQARIIINSYGLKIGKITEKAADCSGCVVSQLIGGKDVEPGAAVKKGSVIELVIGKKDFYYNSGDSIQSALNGEQF